MSVGSQEMCTEKWVSWGMQACSSQRVNFTTDERKVLLRDSKQHKQYLSAWNCVICKYVLKMF